MTDFMKLLATQNQPRSFGEILGETGSAVAGALAGGPQVGQQLAQNRQQRAQEKQLGLQQAIQLSQLVQQEAKLEAQRGDAAAKRFTDAMGPYESYPEVIAAVSVRRAGQEEVMSTLDWTLEFADEAKRRGVVLDETTLQKNLRGAGLKPGTPEYKAAIRASVTKPLVSLPKNVTETQALVEQIDINRAKFAETGDAKFNRTADALEMRLIFGGKPPEAYVKARGALGDAREGVAGMYSLIDKGTGVVLPKDRAVVEQKFSQAVLGFAELTNRGANFTETERELIDSVIGGDPNDIVQRLLRGDLDYLERLQTAGEIIESRGSRLLDSYTDPSPGAFTYPWQADQSEAAVETVPTDTPAPDDNVDAGVDDFSAMPPEERAQAWRQMTKEQRRSVAETLSEEDAAALRQALEGG